MWESPIYKFNTIVDGVSEDLFIDVTGSAPNFSVPGTQLENTFELLLEGLRPERTRILDFGGAKLRNTLHLLKEGFQVYACEFQDLYFRLKQGHDTLQLCEDFSNFNRLVFPTDFVGFDGAFDVILLINVLNIMPVPIERYSVLSLCRKKMSANGRLLWYTQKGMYAFDAAFARLNDGIVTGKRRREYHMFYTEWQREQIIDMLAATGFELNKNYKLSRVSGGNQAYVFKPKRPNIVERSLRLDERLSLEADGGFTQITRKGWRGAEPYETLVPNEVHQLEVVNLLETYARELDLIPPGGSNPSTRNANASKYHWLIFNILSLLFRDKLKRPQMEEKMADDTQRVDISFSNRDDVGFFNQLHDRYEIKCPNIMIECKNYTDDISNPEYHQIQSRLNKRTGLFGMIICRNIDDVELALKRSIFIVKDEKVVITLTDPEIKKLVAHKLENEDDEIDYYLEDKVKEVI